jgi:SAM-dependent methyltransferase
MSADYVQSAISESVRAVSDAFEKSFLCVSLERQIAKCNRYELVPLFRRYLPNNQPILEAGCGCGRWVGWFLNHGWQTAGLDWSETLCARARAGIPGARFEAGDMRAMPFADGEFGSIVALGSVEHVPEGSELVLKEFHRVLKPGGIAIITVPFNGPAQKILRPIKAPMRWLKASKLLRRLLNKPGWAGKRLRDVKKEIVRSWASDYLCDYNGWNFYQYLFTKTQFRPPLKDNGFEVMEEFVGFGDEGILHNFGRMAGKFDYDNGIVLFTPLGKLLRMLIPVNLMGNMLCYVVRKAKCSENL